MKKAPILCTFAAALIAAAGIPSAPVVAGSSTTQAPPARVPEPALSVFTQRSGLQGLLEAMDAHPAVFPAEPLPELRLLPPHQRALALSFWAAFADRLLALERSGEDAAAPGSALTPGSSDLAIRRTAFLARYRFAMDFIERIERDQGLVDLFDEGHAALGLPANAYADLKFHYLHVARATEYAALEVLHRMGADATPPLLVEGAREDSRRILAMGRGSGPILTAANALAVIEGGAHDALMPTQERVARWMGELRVYRKGEPLIRESQIQEIQPQLEPGDILLQRREWFVSNAGIPGFWTHAALYVGTPEERGRFFDDAEVTAWARRAGHANFEALLAARHPKAHVGGTGRDHGHPVRVLEAIAEGVSFTSLEYSAAADSVAVVRPRLSKRERAVALLRAFGYAGRPYDYDFDFNTDSAIVCSELIFKAYQPGEASRGLALPLETVAGRLMMTPNEIARRFAGERSAARRQLDFVLMLDGDERTRSSHPASAETFAESWKRPKWHVVTAGRSATASLDEAAR